MMMKKIILAGILVFSICFYIKADQLNLLGLWNITNYIPSAGGSQAIPNVACALDSNGYLYTAAGNGIFVVDTSTNKVIDNFPLYDSDYAYNLTINGNYLYVADNYNSEVEIYNISNPASVSYVTTLGLLTYAYQNFISGNYMYIANNTSGLIIADITVLPSSAPNPVASVNTTYYSTAVYVSGNASDGNNYAYLCDVTDMQIINVTNPNAPYPVYTYYPQNNSFLINCMYVANNLVYLGEFTEDYSQGNVEVVDVTDSNAPVYKHSTAALGPVLGMTNYGNDLYLGEVSDGMEIMDISNPIVPVSIASASTAGFAMDCVKNNNTIYISDYDEGIMEINISNITSSSASLSPVGSYFNLYDPTIALSVKESGNVSGKYYAYIAGAAIGLLVIDVTNPANPLFAGSLDLPSGVTPGAYDLYLDTASNYAYIANGSGGLVVADVSNPYMPAYVTGYAVPDAAQGVDKQGNYVYVVDAYDTAEGGMEIFDVTYPLSAYMQPDIFPNDGGVMRKVNAVGNYAYIADGTGGMDVVNVSSPASPKLSINISPSAYLDGSVYNVNVNNNIAYLAEYPGAYMVQGLGVADVSGTTMQGYYGLASTNGPARGVIYNTSYAYVACDTSGLYVFDANDPYYIASSLTVPAATLALPGTAYGVYTNDGQTIYVADGEGGLDICQHIRPTATPTITPLGTSTITPTPPNSPTITLTPSATVTYTITVTSTITQTPPNSPTATYTLTTTATYTITMTYTITNTIPPTMTATQSLWTPTPVTFQITGNKVYPNPSNGGVINISYNLSANANQVTIKAFTQGYRLIFQITYQAPDIHTTAGTDVMSATTNLASGSYYYVIEVKDQNNTLHRKIGNFIVIRNTK
jgi:hypothetical protein